MALYLAACKVLNELESKRGSVKSLVFQSKFANKKALYAIVCETLKYRKVLEHISVATNITRLEKTIRSKWLSLVLLYDFIIGKGLRNGGKFKAVFDKHKNALRSELTRMKVKAGVSSHTELITDDTVKLPRYARINFCKANSREDVVQHFVSNGYELLPSQAELVPGTKCFKIDEHVPDLLVFPHNTDLHEDTMYQAGKLVLQDKASCIPAVVLDPPKGSLVVDACSAPGNKTSHLASIMRNTGKVIAFEKNKQRYQMLCKMTQETLGVTNIEPLLQDFTKSDPQVEPYSKVRFALVDPSCSGSGMVNRVDLTNSEGGDQQERNSEKERLRRLAAFQEAIVCHALGFPSIEKVIYSTCSVHEDENEQVVQKVLEKNPHFELEDVSALLHWTNQGSDLGGQFPKGKLCFRATPSKNQTIGFFVSCFKRKEIIKSKRRKRLKKKKRASEIKKAPL